MRSACDQEDHHQIERVARVANRIYPAALASRPQRSSLPTYCANHVKQAAHFRALPKSKAARCQGISSKLAAMKARQPRTTRLTPRSRSPSTTQSMLRDQLPRQSFLGSRNNVWRVQCTAGQHMQTSSVLNCASRPRPDDEADTLLVDICDCNAFDANRQSRSENDTTHNP